MTDLRNAKIDVIFRAHQLANPICLSITVSPITFDLSPLPKDHDLPLFRDERAERAIDEKKVARTRIASEIARKLAPAIAEAVLDTIGQQDPINGYSRDEWERMNKAGA